MPLAAPVALLRLGGAAALGRRELGHRGVLLDQPLRRVAPRLVRRGPRRVGVDDGPAVGRELLEPPVPRVAHAVRRDALAGPDQLVAAERDAGPRGAPALHEAPAEGAADSLRVLPQPLLRRRVEPRPRPAVRHLAQRRVEVVAPGLAVARQHEVLALARQAAPRVGQPDEADARAAGGVPRAAEAPDLVVDAGRPLLLRARPSEYDVTPALERPPLGSRGCRRGRERAGSEPGASRERAGSEAGANAGRTRRAPVAAPTSALSGNPKRSARRWPTNPSPPGRSHASEVSASVSYIFPPVDEPARGPRGSPSRGSGRPARGRGAAAPGRRPPRNDRRRRRTWASCHARQSRSAWRTSSSRSSGSSTNGSPRTSPVSGSQPGRSTASGER